MQDIQLVPITPEQIEVLNIGKPQRSVPLADEVDTLQGAFRLVALAMASRAQKDAENNTDTNSGVVTTYANTLCTLSDSIVRAMLAAQKLARFNDQLAQLHAELKRVLRELGWGEQL